MKSIFIFSVSLLASILFSASSYALLIDRGIEVLDIDTALYWLELGETLGSLTMTFPPAFIGANERAGLFHVDRSFSCRSSTVER